MEPNDVVCAVSVPGTLISPTTASARGVNGLALEIETSAPRSERAWSRTDSWRLSVNELMATSAATPATTAVVRRPSRRSDRLSRQAIRSANGIVLGDRAVRDHGAVPQAHDAPRTRGQALVVGHQDEGG